MVGRVLVLLYEVLLECLLYSYPPVCILIQGISPSNILAITFTTAAAAEMRERIGVVAGKAAAKELTISTFHSFSLQLCRLHAKKYVLPKLIKRDFFLILLLESNIVRLIQWKFWFVYIISQHEVKLITWYDGGYYY